MQHLPVTGVEIDAQGLRSAAHVADAHGAGVGVAPDFMEGLDLHGADKGDQGVGQGLHGRREEAHPEQQDDLAEEDDLPPKDKGVMPQYDVRADKWDIAQNAMDGVNKERIAKGQQPPSGEADKKDTAQGGATEVAGQPT